MSRAFIQNVTGLFKKPVPAPVTLPTVLPTPSISLPAGAGPIVVQPGDTLSSLGREYGFDWTRAKIKRSGQIYDIGADGINPQTIYPNDEIIPSGDYNPEDLGHGLGIDNDVAVPPSEVESVAQKAHDTGGDDDVEKTAQSCPQCKVAIVVGHNSKQPGAASEKLGQAEFPYNTDIAHRTVKKITEKSHGKITAEVFNRKYSGSYSKEVANCYSQVNQYLKDVPSPKRVAIELHYNASASGSASYALTIYKGDVAFAKKSAKMMAQIYGVSDMVKRYQDNDRGKATFTNGPTNTYLMEPFFGTHEKSAELAATEEGRDKLADVYSELLVGWIG